ncbi:MAG: FHA domain-containing protein, partial [Beutenbergiaceae bacterium]
MSAVCPQGHTSEQEDYCDTCGSPIGAGAASTASAAPDPAPADPKPSAAGPSQCPHCGAPAAPLALFCENCGYDFTTGATPAVEAPAATGTGTPDVEGASEPGPASEDGSSEGNGPATATESGEEAQAPTAGSLPSLASGTDWVAELWTDPEWYKAQDPEDPMPALTAPVVVPLTKSTVLVGRPSTSRGIDPDVDAGSDTGVSRRHCQLSTDGHRWWVEDLDSANGTYVSPIGEALPTSAIPAGSRKELADGDRVFIGAWTRLQIR